MSSASYTVPAANPISDRDIGNELMEQFRRIESLTSSQATHGFRTNQIILSVNSELGEICEAIAAEDGHIDRRLDESSIVECADLISCVMSLYFSRGGTIDELASILRRKTDKWKSKLDARYSKVQPS